jgi:hypothetical protein
LKALLLRRHIASDQDNGPQPLLQIALEKQRNFVDDQFVAGIAVLPNALFRKGANPGVDNGFELFSRRGIAENDFPELVAINRAVGLKDIRTERGNDLAPTIAVRLDDLTGEVIGIDDGGSVSSQDCRHRGFSRSDAAGEAD